jgi:hypothetical protein
MESKRTDAGREEVAAHGGEMVGRSRAWRTPGKSGHDGDPGGRARRRQAAVALTTARTVAVAITHQGRLNRPIRCSTIDSRRGTKAIHASTPMAVPITAATRPTTAPLASMRAERAGLSGHYSMGLRPPDRGALSRALADDRRRGHAE